MNFFFCLICYWGTGIVVLRAKIEILERERTITTLASSDPTHFLQHDFQDKNDLVIEMSITTSVRPGSTNMARNSPQNELPIHPDRLQRQSETLDSRTRLQNLSTSSLTRAGFSGSIETETSSGVSMVMNESTQEYDDGYSPNPSEMGDIENGSDGSSRSVMMDIPSSSEESDSFYDFTERKDPFVDSLTGKRASSSQPVRVRESFQETTYPGSINELPLLLQDVQKYDSEVKQAEKRKRVIGDTLPALTSLRKFSDLASFLKVADDLIQASAITELQKLVLDIRKCQDRKMTNELVEVSKHCKWVMGELEEDHPNFHSATTLFLLTFSALLSRCPPASLEQWTELGLREKGGGGGGEGGDVDMLSAEESEELRPAVLSVLKENNEGGKTDSLDNKHRVRHLWRNASFSDEERTQRRVQFGRASLRQIVVHIFTLLNELRHQEWSGTGQSGMTQTLAELHKEIHNRSTKEKTSEEALATVQFYLLEGLVILLKSTFQEEELKIGEQEGNYIHQMTHLILEIVEKSSSPLKQHFLCKVESLLSHRCFFIRNKIKALLFAKKRTNSQLALGSIEDKLKHIGFHADPVSSSCVPIQRPPRERDKTPPKVCEWRTFQCTLGGLKAEVTVYCRHHDCEMHTEIGECLERHPEGRERCGKKRKHIRELCQRRQRNMDMLKILSPQCPHILQLHAFQNLPEPFFITEQVQSRRLLMHVLEHGRAKHWLPNPTLIYIMLNVLEGLKFLASKGIDPRDVTAYNWVVQPKENCLNGQSRTKSSILDAECNFDVKIADLGLAHQYRCVSGSPGSCNNAAELRPVCHQGPIPLRWTAPEALWEGVCSEKSMTFSAGCLAYELFTHGCQPFTSYDLSTEDLLIKMLMFPESVMLHQWRCIPDSIFRLIRRCTHHDPSQRPSLADFQRDLRQIRHLDKQEDKELSLLEDLATLKKYPPLNKDQVERDHVPETGIPPSLQQLLDSAETSALYNNTMKSMWEESSSIEVTPDELTAVDPIYITHYATCTEVKEPLSMKFVTDDLSSLKVSGLTCVTCWSDNKEVKPKLRNQDGQFEHERKYPQTMSLYDAALRGVFSTENRIQILESLARAVNTCHQKEWLLRDLKASNVLVDCSDGEVIFPRIGRMCHASSSENCFFDERFEDSRRWLAPEVLLSGAFGKENDVFMMGTVMWEVFHIRDMASRNPLASRKDFAPCANIPKEKVVEHVREEKSLPHSTLCPRWLRRLIDACRCADAWRRPSAADVVKTMQQYNPSGPRYSPFLVDPRFQLDLEDYQQLKKPAGFWARRKTKIKHGLTLQRKTKHPACSENYQGYLDSYQVGNAQSTDCSGNPRRHNRHVQFSGMDCGFPGQDQQTVTGTGPTASKDQEPRNSCKKGEDCARSFQPTVQPQTLKTEPHMLDEGVEIYCDFESDLPGVTNLPPQFPSESQGAEGAERRQQRARSEETEVKRPLSYILYEDAEPDEENVVPKSHCRQSSKSEETGQKKKKRKWAFWKRDKKKKTKIETKISDKKTTSQTGSLDDVETMQHSTLRKSLAPPTTATKERINGIENIYEERNCNKTPEKKDGATVLCSTVKTPATLKGLSEMNEIYENSSWTWIDSNTTAKPVDASLVRSKMKCPDGTTIATLEGFGDGEVTYQEVGEEIYEEIGDTYHPNTVVKNGNTVVKKDGATMVHSNMQSPSDRPTLAIIVEGLSDVEEIYDYANDPHSYSNSVVNKDAATMVNSHTQQMKCVSTCSATATIEVHNNLTSEDNMEDSVYNNCEASYPHTVTNLCLPPSSTSTLGLQKSPPPPLLSPEEIANRIPAFPSELEGPVGISTWRRHKPAPKDKPDVKTYDQCERGILAGDLMTNSRGLGTEAVPRDGNIMNDCAQIPDKSTFVESISGRNHNPTALPPQDYITNAQGLNEDYSNIDPDMTHVSKKVGRAKSMISDSDSGDYDDDEDTGWPDSEFDSDWDMADSASISDGISPERRLYPDNTWPVPDSQNDPPTAQSDANYGLSCDKSDSGTSHLLQSFPGESCEPFVPSPDPYREDC